MIRNILTLISSLAPKFDKIILISYPDWEDMTLALIDEFKKLDKKVFLLILNKSSKKYFHNLPSNIKILKRISFKGLYHLVTSKIIFCTHGTLFTKVPKNLTIINLWHGFGFKAVGTYLGKKEGHPSSVVIGSSEYSKQFFAKEMNIHPKKVLALGFPRNDRLLNAFNNKEEIKKSVNFNKFRSVIIWMPTYRSSVYGDLRIDGIQYNNPFNLEKFNLNLFMNFLQEENILLLFRAHPMSMRFILPESENFQITNDAWLHKNQISLYQLLGITDLLISDVSSVITDYLIINKPIIHAMSDFDEYVASRAMLLNPPKEFLVGPLVKNQESLKSEIMNSLNNTDLYYDKREKYKKLFFDNNTDNKSTERVLKHFKLL